MRNGPESVKERLNVSPDDGVRDLLACRVLHRESSLPRPLLVKLLATSRPRHFFSEFVLPSFASPSLKLSFLFNFLGRRVPRLRRPSSLEFRTEKQLQLLTQELDLTTGCPPQIGGPRRERLKGSRCGRSSLLPLLVERGHRCCTTM